MRHMVYRSFSILSNKRLLCHFDVSSCEDASKPAELLARGNPKDLPVRIYCAIMLHTNAAVLALRFSLIMQCTASSHAVNRINTVGDNAIYYWVESSKKSKRCDEKQSMMQHMIKLEDQM